MYLFSDGFQIGEREADRGIQLGYLKKKKTSTVSEMYPTPFSPNHLIILMKK